MQASGPATDRRTGGRVFFQMRDDSNMMRRTRKTLRLATIVGLALAGPAVTFGQTAGDSVKPATPPVRDSTVVELAPSRPRQGSILRITVRPVRPLGTTDTAGTGVRPADTATLARTDTVARAAAWTIPQVAGARPESLAAARRDSVAVLRADSLARPRPDSLPARRDSLSLRIDSIAPRPASPDSTAAVTSATTADSTPGRILAIRG